MTWMLTGGAGYIGAHIIRALQSSGRDVVVLDDLTSGLKRKVPSDVPLLTIDVCDSAAVTAAMRAHSVEGVVHLAAKKAVGESVARPLYYYRQNLGGAMALAEAMVSADVPSIVFSSSASVYGSSTDNPVLESSATVPVSPYGETKVASEWLFRAAAQAHGLACVALRYFNVAGAGSDELGDVGAFNLIPMTLRSLTQGERPKIFGNDYPTPDGTCIRDYIHVTDLANAHVAAATRTEARNPFEAYNIGRGIGSSVSEVMSAVSAAVGRDVNPEVVQRRAGDPAAVVGSVELARTQLGWTASRDLDAMVTSAWSAWQANPPAGS